MSHDNSPNSQREQTLAASTKDGVSHAVMLGAGETYIGAFAVYLLASPLQISVLSALPVLCGALAQLPAVLYVDRAAWRLRAILFLARSQASIWLFLALLPFFFQQGHIAVSILGFLMVVYYILGGSIVPMWNSLIGDLVPTETRGAFFGRRGRWCAAGTLVATVIAGSLIALAQNFGKPLWGFSFVFLCACGARLLSAYFLSKHEDIPHSVLPHEKFTFLQFIRQTPRSNFARFVLAGGLMLFSVWFATPLFAIYMLRVLGLNFFEYTTLTGAMILAQIICFSFWGSLSDRVGNKTLLELSAVGIAVVPLLWLFSGNLIYLTILQLISGTAWAGFNLCSANFIFDAVSPKKRARCVAYQGVVNGIFVICGSLLGGYFASRMSEGLPFHRYFAVPNSIFLDIFLISGCLRLLAAIALKYLFAEVRDVKPLGVGRVPIRFANIRAIAELVIRPIPMGIRGDASESDATKEDISEDL